MQVILVSSRRNYFVMHEQKKNTRRPMICISKVASGIGFSKNTLAAEGGTFFKCLLLILDLYARNPVSFRL